MELDKSDSKCRAACWKLTLFRREEIRPIARSLQSFSVAVTCYHLWVLYTVHFPNIVWYIYIWFVRVRALTYKFTVTRSIVKEAGLISQMFYHCWYSLTYELYKPLCYSLVIRIIWRISSVSFFYLALYRLPVMDFFYIEGICFVEIGGKSTLQHICI